MNRMLIVEDDPIIAKVYGAKYAESGFETRVAEDGKKGLELLETFKPDIVHLDLLVPNVNGVEIIKHIRKNPLTRDMPVLVLSNTYQNTLVKAAISAGATHCVSKATCTPKSMVSLVQKIKAARTGQTEPLSAAQQSPATGSARDAGSPRHGKPGAASSPTSPGAASSPTSEVARHAASSAEIRADFLRRAPGMIEALQARLQPLFRSPTPSALLGDLSGLCRATHSFAGQAGMAGLRELAEISSALVALLRELLDSPRPLGASAMRTIVDAVDFLAVLLGRASESVETNSPPLILVVDDDLLSRRAAVNALARLHVSTLAVDTPQAALRLMVENHFNLVLLDIGMPGMDGFELCRQLRMLPTNEATPVVFVTSATDPGYRDRAMESGANDIITKPFPAMELAVKALSLMRRQSPDA
jgi:CheY-like chemotaxis protein